MAMPVILKGDTSARISFSLTDNFSYEGYSLRVDFHHVSYVIYDLKAGSTVSVQYTAEDTSRFPLGTGLMTLTLENEEGVRRTLPVERVKVTDAPAEVYDGAIIIDPGVAKVEELPERFTDNDVRSKINQILSFLRRCAAFCLLGIMSYGFVAASVLTAPKGEIYNDSPVVTNVNLEGLAKTDEVMPRKYEGYWETIADGMGLHLRRINGTEAASFTPGGVDVGGTVYQDGKIYYNGQYLSLPSISKVETFAVKSDISATNTTFSNAVLAVGLNIDTNSVAVLNEIASTFGGFPIEGTATTVGGLLAALAAAVAWLKKNKADKENVLPRYQFTSAGILDGVVTVPPYTSATMPGDGTAFTVAVGEGNGYMRDCILCVVCGDVTPTITWTTNFHPRTDAETDFACVASATNVYWISEYAQGEFVVAGWQATAGGSAV